MLAWLLSSRGRFALGLFLGLFLLIAFLILPILIPLDRERRRQEVVPEEVLRESSFVQLTLRPTLPTPTPTSPPEDSFLAIPQWVPPTGLPPTIPPLPVNSEEPLEGEGTGFGVTFADLSADRDLLQSLDLPIPPAGGRQWGSGKVEWGVQINGCDEPLQPALDLVVEHGFGWVKQQVRWGDMEYLRNGRRAIRWQCLDQVIGESRRRGLRVLLSVTTAPVHLRPPSQRDNTLGPPGDLMTFAQFLSALLVRYEGQIDAIEIWNEPNLDAEWREGVNPLRYTFLLKLAALTIRTHDPNIVIISGGLAPIDQSEEPRYMNDLKFWETMHEYGAALWVDCIGYHANGPPPNGFFDGVVARYRNVMEKQDPLLRRPLCLTEVSFSLPFKGQTPPDFAWAIAHTEEEQAERFRTWIAQGENLPFLRLAIVFNLNYIENGAVTPNSIAAIARPDLRGLTLGVFREALRR